MTLDCSLERFEATGDPEVYQSVILDWQRASFSEASDQTLTRYFRRQLFELSQLDTAATLALIDHLWQHHSNFLDTEQTAPPVYQRQLADRLAPALDSVRTLFRQDAMVQAYLQRLSVEASHLRFTYRELFYFRDLVMALANSRPDNAPDMLVCWNFNDLAYLAARQRELAGLADRAALEAEKLRLTALPERVMTAYDPDWPSLRTMLLAWLNERLALPDESPVAAPKLTLNLSVAQLGCFLRLAYQQGIFREENLAAILRFFATHFSAKRQAFISAGSLTKEYYATNQKTAAVVLDQLQALAGRLKRCFFPA